MLIDSGFTMTGSSAFERHERTSVTRKVWALSDEIVKTAQEWKFKKRTTKGDVAPAPKP
jgi:hypothetical protein